MYASYDSQVMIERTFQLLPSIGVSMERRLWSSGIPDWETFLGSDIVPGISQKRKTRLDSELETAKGKLAEGRYGFFASKLPTREHWRLYRKARDDAAFLDIETDGLGGSAIITVVSVTRGGSTTTLVRGSDLDRDGLNQALEGTTMLVTFNGLSFDIPMIAARFKDCIPTAPHLDLRHACRKVGLTGGLKAIERKLGMTRAQEVEYVTGKDAIHLWHLWQRRGNQAALNTLMRYNVMDTENLVPLADTIYEIMEKRLLDESRKE